MKVLTLGEVPQDFLSDELAVGRPLVKSPNSIDFIGQSDSGRPIPVNGGRHFD
jgi:hypothetical protein